MAIQCVCLCSLFCQWYLVYSFRFEPKIEGFPFSHNYIHEVPVRLNPELKNLKIFVVFLLWYRCLYTDITEGDLFFDPKLGHLVSSSIVKLNFRRNITRSCESSLVQKKDAFKKCTSLEFQQNSSVSPKNVKLMPIYSYSPSKSVFTSEMKYTASQFTLIHCLEPDSVHQAITTPPSPRAPLSYQVV